MMWRAAASKFPCSRPALYDEYAEGRILGLPERNVAGAEVRAEGTARQQMPGSPGVAACHHYIKRTIRWCAILYSAPLNGAPFYTAHHSVAHHEANCFEHEMARGVCLSQA